MYNIILNNRYTVNLLTNNNAENHIVLFTSLMLLCCLYFLHKENDVNIVGGGGERLKESVVLHYSYTIKKTKHAKDDSYLYLV